MGSIDMKRMAIAWALAAIFVAAFWVPVSTQATPADKVRIAGWALNLSNVATGANQTIQIDINSWSTPAQRTRLIQTFLEKGQNGLVSALEKEPERGRFRFPGVHGT
jgi:hypothetical protein